MKYVLSEKIKFYYKLKRIKPTYECNGVVLDIEKMIYNKKIQISKSSHSEYVAKDISLSLNTYRGFSKKYGGVVRWFIEMIMFNEKFYNTFVLYSIEEKCENIVGFNETQISYYIRGRYISKELRKKISQNE